MYLLTLLLLLVPASGTPPPANAAFAAKCGVPIQKGQPVYLFYQMNTDRWTKYTEWSRVPEPGEQDQLLTVYRSPEGGVYTMRSIPGEQFSSEQHDCYAANGKLRFLHFHGDAQAWSYDENRDYATAKAAVTKAFSDGQTHKPIKRPADAEKLGDDLAPKLYLKLEQAPYAGFVRGK
jgi:hypothetical protein